MNERIRELNLQAMSIVMNGSDPDGDVERMYIPSEFTKKFAQLIVRECLDIVNRKEYSYHEADPLWETSQLIKEHFGVE
jgi:hypothetical protein